MSGMNENWLSLTELATHLGVSIQAVSKRVRRLEDQGLIKSRRGDGGTKLVELGAYGHAARVAIDSVRASNGTKATPGHTPLGLDDAGSDDDKADPILAKEQARHKKYQADMAEMERDRRRGDLLEKSDIVAATEDCGTAIVSVIEGLPSMAERVSSAEVAEGDNGARRVLREIAREMRETITRKLIGLKQHDPAAQES